MAKENFYWWCFVLQVVSPSQQVDSKFRWSIDQLATLQPANIETSPYNQLEGFSDPEYEQQAQDAIDKWG